MGSGKFQAKNINSKAKVRIHDGCMRPTLTLENLAYPPERRSCIFCLQELSVQ